MANVTDQNISEEALRDGLKAYSRDQLTNILSLVTSAKASVDSTLSSVSGNKASLETELANSGLEAKEAALKARLDAGASSLSDYVGRPEVPITSQVQLGLLTSSIASSLDVDDELYVNILFDLNRYRFLISELGAETSRLTGLSAYYTKVISIVNSVLSTLPP